MKRTFSAALAAIVLAVTAIAPAAEARDHHGRRDGYHDGRGGDRHDRGGRGRYHGRGDYYYRDHDRGDAAAAGVIGLVVGLALGAALSEDRNDRPRGSGYYERDPRYADPRYSDDRYDDRYADGGRSAYEEDYGDAAPPPRRSECTRRERQWDRYANRYVTVDVPC